MDPTHENIFYDAGCNLNPLQENIFYYDAECDLNPIQENILYEFEAGWKNPLVVSTPFELLKVYGTKTKRLHIKEKVTEQICDPPSQDSSSATTIMKLARSRLLELNLENLDVVSVLSKAHKGSKHEQINLEEKVDLGMALQASAELVAKKRFVSARKLLNRCQDSASKTGTPFQRIVYYFAQALRQKMDQEWGFITPDGMAEKNRKPIDVMQTLMTLRPARMSCEQELSTSVVCQYTSIQSILENVSTAKKVHLIDLRIKNGSHWTFLIQALAVRYECPIELLKITAIGTSRELLEETGKRLSSFAMTKNVPFYYDVVLSDLKEIKTDMFQINADETLAIYSSMCFWSMLVCPNDLEKSISVIKDLKPCLLMINEADVTLNSPDFLKRFTETLFHSCVIFDGLMINFKNHPFRKLTEEDHYRDNIRNTITCEGTERYCRLENSSFWRTLFAKCGFVETELSPSALSQAQLLLDRSAFRSLLHMDTDGKCLSVGCNGTPLEFLSAWKLH